MSGSILVTSGTIGDFVVKGLTKKGKKVRVTTYKKQSKPLWDVAGIEQVEVDYAKPETLARAFDGIESYFSVSPLIRELSETGIQAVNAAKKAGVRRIVRSSDRSPHRTRPRIKEIQNHQRRGHFVTGECASTFGNPRQTRGICRRFQRSSDERYVGNGYASVDG